jgi:hypothetical protein
MPSLTLRSHHAALSSEVTTSLRPTTPRPDTEFLTVPFTAVEVETLAPEAVPKPIGKR